MKTRVTCLDDNGVKVIQVGVSEGEYEVESAHPFFGKRGTLTTKQSYQDVLTEAVKRVVMKHSAEIPGEENLTERLFDIATKPSHVLMITYVLQSYVTKTKGRG